MNVYYPNKISPEQCCKRCGFPVDTRNITTKQTGQFDRFGVEKLSIHCHVCNEEIGKVETKEDAGKIAHTY